MERLREQYNKEIAAKLKDKFGYKNVMNVPKVTKIVINVGIGKYIKDGKFQESIQKDLERITSQKTVPTIAKKSIAGFKIREGQVVGYTTTLRGDRMYNFLDKLINVTLPRVKDFRGISPKGFDGRGNFHLGLKEQVVFPEVPADSLDKVFSLEISIVTNAGKDEPARELLSLYKFPFKKN